MTSMGAGVKGREEAQPGISGIGAKNETKGHILLTSCGFRTVNSQHAQPVEMVFGEQDSREGSSELLFPGRRCPERPRRKGCSPSPGYVILAVEMVDSPAAAEDGPLPGKPRAWAMTARHDLLLVGYLHRRSILCGDSGLRVCRAATLASRSSSGQPVATFDNTLDPVELSPPSLTPDRPVRGCRGRPGVGQGRLGKRLGWPSDSPGGGGSLTAWPLPAAWMAPLLLSRGRTVPTEEERLGSGLGTQS